MQFEVLVEVCVKNSMDVNDSRFLDEIKSKKLQEGNKYICLGVLGMYDYFVLVNDDGAVVAIPTEWAYDD